MSTADNKNEKQHMYRQNHVLMRVLEALVSRCRREGLGIEDRYQRSDGSSYRNFLVDVLEIAKESIPENVLRTIIKANYSGMRVGRKDRKVGFFKSNLFVDVTATTNGLQTVPLKRTIDELYEDGDDKSLAKLTSIKHDMDSEFNFFEKCDNVIRSEIQQTLSVVCNGRSDDAVMGYMINGSSHVDRSMRPRDCKFRNCGPDVHLTRVDVDDNINNMFVNLARRLKDRLDKLS